jgi:hypothetical protein
MFRTNTCFVLGAGISKPFGFPVGNQMQKAICDSQYVPTTDFVGIIAKVLPADKSDAANKLVEAFKLSDVYSIDNWLETNQDNADLLMAGKLAISAVIMNAEATGLGLSQGGYIEGDWFAWLWNNMRTTKIENLSENNVRFVTFNYDRLFEWKLNQQIRNTYLQASGEEHKAALDWAQSRIVHAHGALGDADDLLKDYGQFGFARLGHGVPAERIRYKDLFAVILRDHARSINIVCENPSDDTKLIKTAQTWLKEAQKVVFLGFSYDKRNLEKLNIKHLSSIWPKAVGGSLSPEDLINDKVVGTAMGLGPAERRAIRSLSANTIALDSSNLDALTFCRHFVEVA